VQLSLEKISDETYCHTAETSSIQNYGIKYAKTAEKEPKDNTISKRQHKCYHNIDETENSGESQPNPESR
jgi:hypothetical protein